MARYRIVFRRSVARDLRSVPKDAVQRILSRVKMLADDPRPPGCERLTGQERYRVRQGSYRIIYTVEDGTSMVTVVKTAAHRGGAYHT